MSRTYVHKPVRYHDWNDNTDTPDEGDKLNSLTYERISEIISSGSDEYHTYHGDLELILSPGTSKGGYMTNIRPIVGGVDSVMNIVNNDECVLGSGTGSITAPRFIFNNESSHEAAEIHTVITSILESGTVDSPCHILSPDNHFNTRNQPVIDLPDDVLGKNRGLLLTPKHRDRRFTKYGRHFGSYVRAKLLKDSNNYTSGNVKLTLAIISGPIKDETGHDKERREIKEDGPSGSYWHDWPHDAGRYFKRYANDGQSEQERDKRSIRQRTKGDLHDAARLFNAGEDIDDIDSSMIAYDHNPEKFRRSI